MKTPKEGKYFESVGRRKTSVARVRMWMQKGKIIANNKIYDSYFPGRALQKIVEDPLIIPGLLNKVTLIAKISGGGIHSQAEAFRHGIARAIIQADAEQRKPLKRQGFLKRDPRMKERRKFGLKKARKAPQWAKR